MIFKNLGNSAVKISAIGMGLGGNFGKNSDLQSIDLIKTAVDNGTNFFDTAEVYLDGHSEEILGKAIKKIRDRVIIASKFSPNHSRKKGVIKALDGSLRRLKSDYIDLYQVHWPNLKVPLEETISTLEGQLKKGKIRFIGVSNFSLKRIKESLKRLNGPHLTSVQNEYNFSERGAEKDILPFCNKNNITFIAYNPLGPGLPLKNRKKSQLLSKLAKQYGKNQTQIVLNWLISKPNVVAIPSTTSKAHLRENVECGTFSLERKDSTSIDKTFEQKVRLIPVSKIKISDDGKTCLTLEDALNNIYSSVPSPLELAQEIKAGDFLKPIKLKKIASKSNQKYLLSGGKIRFWAWVIAFGDRKPVPSVID